MEQYEQIHLTINLLMDTWSELTQRLIQHPDQLINGQINYWQDYQKLFQNLSQQQFASPDKRFQYTEWQENSVFNFIMRSYLLFSQHLETLINEMEQKDEKLAKKLRFYAHQYIDAISPTNFANINPEILSKTFETKGINLIAGFKQFLQDLERGQLNIQSTDLELFKLGENIACTPGKVIYQNDLMQLIQYTATTKEVYQYPLLIIPPWINKYYILDLQQENSFVKWLVDQGFTVFMISWVNPSSEHQAKQFEDYMFEGPLAALNKIEEIIQEKKINILGYCIGGTLLGCMLAYLAEKNDSRILSATFITTLFDFSEPGELGTFVDEKQITMLEKFMQTKGYLDGNVMACVFNALRANDLVWSSFVNNYLKGEKPKPFDLLYWNSDSTNIPEKVHSFYLRNMYLNNFLIQPNKIKMGDVSLDLSKITIPSYFLAAQEDHIIPWVSCYKSKQNLKCEVEFVLTSSGHVAGVVNPPHKKKYGYWTNKKSSKTPEKFLLDAKHHEGSWWEDWIKWLGKYSGQLVSADTLKTLPQIENAPGSYVKVRSLDISTEEIIRRP